MLQRGYYINQGITSGKQFSISGKPLSCCRYYDIKLSFFFILFVKEQTYQLNFCASACSTDSSIYPFFLKTRNFTKTPMLVQKEIWYNLRIWLCSSHPSLSTKFDSYLYNMLLSLYTKNTSELEKIYKYFLHHSHYYVRQSPILT